MRSISVSDYREYCAALVREVVNRRSMYYHELVEIEAMLYGHWRAFDQIGGAERSMAFHGCFSAWLEESKSASCSSGWAYAVTELASKANCDVNTLFAELVNEFLPVWIGLPVKEAPSPPRPDAPKPEE